jgi:hypothetical protein
MKKSLAVLVTLFAMATGCKRIGTASVELNFEPIVPDSGDGYLMFDLQPLADRGAAARYDCIFKSEGKTAHFQFEVVSTAPSGDPPISFASGKIISVPSSDASVFLQRLQKTLDAKTFPAGVERVGEIPFTAAILGTHQSHSKEGGFFTKPPGNWTAMKIFIGKKDDPAEVFLNFNPVLHKGEFSIKDPDYGDEVLKELAKVL